METTNQLSVGKEYEIKGYPQDFPEIVRGVYLGKGERTHYFAFNRDDKRVFVSVDAHFAELNDGIVSTSSLSKFATFLFKLDELKDKNTKSELIKILNGSGEEL